MLPYTAYLRVYQPVTAFSPRDRRYWEGYAESADRPRRVNALAAEHTESLGRLITTPPVVAPVEESGHAYLRRVNERLYVCPWQTRLRSWRAFDEFTGSAPRPLAEACVPAREAERAEAGYRQWRESGARAQPGILSSNWTVPVPWFVPFEPQERCLVLSAGNTRTLLYLTRTALATRRLEHTAAVLRERVGEHAVSSSTEELLDWLSTTAHPDSLLELDYGGLPHLLSDDHLSEDHSVAEVAEAVEALAKGDGARVTELRRRITRRWRSVRALDRTN
ncbi:hypothetical protein GCM10007079_48130 [Nocardiopsis terrae]|uniref:DUF8083 domain-containing protein n=1 Tax=Nocardiopsis terrae TaxID=372655 RepID=A0ABR9HAZ0_9ACTN|nr:hypothetical protein [Nocardiopsis terrae]MBE1456071.1 hypothetical protein [Nocardiopsis terrae]GHC96031.1 hypothetical protein GCM10007079_48130 [Nocardiopsis terrae]